MNIKSLDELLNEILPAARRVKGDDRVSLRSACGRVLAEDLAPLATGLLKGTRLTSRAIGCAAAQGFSEVPVYRQLSVGLMSTGAELASPGAPLPEGGTYDSNRFMLHALLEKMCCTIEDFGIVPGTLEATRKALRKAGALHDLVLSSGGLSVDVDDRVRQAVVLEGELMVNDVAALPGSALAWGRVGSADFFCLPGDPEAAYAAFQLIVRPFILKCQGAAPDAAGDAQGAESVRVGDVVHVLPFSELP